MDVKTFLFGDQEVWFLAEVLLRSAISFVVVLFALRLTGKRGVRQLTLFELVILLTLGSAAGDVCFYDDVGILPVLICIVTIIILYRVVTYWVMKSDSFEHMIEGTPVMIVENGRLTSLAAGQENISFDEFFMELRLKNIDHLGQVRYAFLEVNGDVSVFRQDQEDVRPGLCILPHIVQIKMKQYSAKDLFSCTQCGYTEVIDLTHGMTCPSCQNKIWVKGSDRGVQKDKT